MNLERRDDPDRLSQIESKLAVQGALIGKQGETLEKIETLLERTVTVEERQSQVFDRLKHIEKDLDDWRIARRIIIWVVGLISTTIVAAVGIIVSSIYAR